MRLTESVDFVYEEYGASFAEQVGMLGLLDNLAYVLYPALYGAELIEGSSGFFGEYAGQGGLTRSGRPPEDHGGNQAAFDLQPNGFARTEQVPLSDKVIEFSRPEPLRQWCIHKIKLAKFDFGLMEKRTEKTDFRFLIVPVMAVLSIWFVFSLEIRLGVNWNDWGVLPRTAKGLRGVLFSPFIHGSLSHLSNNTIALFVMLSAVFYFYSDKAWRVLLWSFLGSGLLTWVIGRESYHIGASGIIYALVAFVFFKGIWSKYYRWIALSLGTVFVYGSLIWYILPIKDGISWEGHLSGFLTGLLLALTLHFRVTEPTKYAWEREDYDESSDPFMQQFDEEGNFRPLPPPGQEEEDDTASSSNTGVHGKWVSNSTLESGSSSEPPREED